MHCEAISSKSEEAIYKVWYGNTRAINQRHSSDGKPGAPSRFGVELRGRRVRSSAHPTHPKKKPTSTARFPHPSIGLDSLS